MAKQSGQHCVPPTLKLKPEAGKSSSGKVLDKQGQEVASWHSPQGTEIKVEVGNARQGTITEEGFNDRDWQIICINKDD